MGIQRTLNKYRREYRQEKKVHDNHSNNKKRVFTMENNFLGKTRFVIWNIFTHVFFKLYFDDIYIVVTL